MTVRRSLPVGLTGIWVAGVPSGSVTVASPVTGAPPLAAVAAAACAWVLSWTACVRPRAPVSRAGARVSRGAEMRRPCQVGDLIKAGRRICALSQRRR